jgi:hypothetical protein
MPAATPLVAVLVWSLLQRVPPHVICANSYLSMGNWVGSSARRLIYNVIANAGSPEGTSDLCRIDKKQYP